MQLKTLFLPPKVKGCNLPRMRRASPLVGTLQYGDPMQRAELLFSSIQIERDPDTGLLVGNVPGIPGAHTQGETVDEIRANLTEVTQMLQEHTGVVLKKPVPEIGLDAGSSGVVVHAHGQGAAYEVEFLTQYGQTICVETIKPEDLTLAPLPAMHDDVRKDLPICEERSRKPKPP